jgi:hypothetical protein
MVEAMNSVRTPVMGSISAVKDPSPAVTFFTSLSAKPQRNWRAYMRPRRKSVRDATSGWSSHQSNQD